MNILFRVDANTQIGIGHFVRSLALAQELKDRRHQVSFLGFLLSPVLKKILVKNHIQFLEMNERVDGKKDLKIITETAKSLKANWVVLDGYKFVGKFQRNLAKKHICRLMIIDDLAKSFVYGDLLVNQNSYANQRLYDHKAFPETRLLLGSRFALLRREFRNIGRKIGKRKLKKILVMMGGVDPHNQTCKVLDALNRVAGNFEVDVVLGPGNRFSDKVKRSAQRLKRKVVLHQSPENICDLMKNADLIVSASGSTCWEMCAMGIPSVLMVLFPNQKAVAESLEQYGAGINLGGFRNVKQDSIARAVNRLMASESLCSRMSRRAKSLVDGKGASRVRVEMERILAA